MQTRRHHPRLDGEHLAIPGLIGPSVEWTGELAGVFAGPDAGFPGFQRLDEWKGAGMVLVEPDELTPAARERLGLRRPADELAELDAHEAELLAQDVDPLSDPRKRDALWLAGRARLQAVGYEANAPRAVNDLPRWIAGYSRNSTLLWLHRVTGDSRTEAWVSTFGGRSTVDALDGSVRDEPRVWQAFRARWADRVFRALSGGVVSACGLLYARRRESWGDPPVLVEDEVARRGVEAAARLVAGDDVVEVPLHGRLRRRRLPGFTVGAARSDPFDRDHDPRDVRDVYVPPEDLWY